MFSSTSVCVQTESIDLSQFAKRVLVQYYLKQPPLTNFFLCFPTYDVMKA